MDCVKWCSNLGKSKSVLKGIEFNLPKTCTITEYFRDCLMNGTIKSDLPAILGDRQPVAYTYRQLDSMSTLFGKALRQLLGFWTSNNPDGDLVMAFCLSVSENIPVVVLAILKLGAAYLAIPTTYPEQVIVKIVGAARPMVVITEEDGPTKARFDCVRHLLTVIGVDTILELAQSGKFDDVNEVVPLETLVKLSKRVACIVYTAGTKDEPQAVRIGHGEILNRCLWQYKTFPYAGHEVASMSSCIEDADSIAEIVAPILAGIPLYLISTHILSKPQNLIMKIEEIQISRITLAPPAFSAVLNAYEDILLEDKNQRPLKYIRYWVVSGDTLPKKLAKRFFSLVAPTPVSSPHSKSKGDLLSPVLVHLYGSTEVMSDVSFETFEDQMHLDMKFNDGNVSIGRPIGNTIIYIVDEDMRIVEKGNIGEICVAGACVAMGGYVGETAMNNANPFCTNPFTKQKGFCSMYKTGDFGRIIENKGGSSYLFYEGRTEMTAKVGGKQIDLRNIIKAVNDTKLVEQCTVLCYHPDKEDQILVACCKVSPGVALEALESAVENEIDDQQLIPKIFPVEEFKYLPSGRLDKHRLLKQYQYYRMNASAEEWESLHRSVGQREAAKVLFTAIANFTGQSLRSILNQRGASMWSIGVNSLNAVGIFLLIREHGYLIEMEKFLVADSLMSIVDIMGRSIVKPTADDQLTISLDHLAQNNYKVLNLNETQYKDVVIQMLSKCYTAKHELSVFLSALLEDHSKFLECNWKQIVKANLSSIMIAIELIFEISKLHHNSLVAVTRAEPARLVGAVIVLDSHTKYKLPSECPLSIKYIREITDYSEKEPRDHMVGRKTGTVTQIMMIGTSESVPTMNNILLISYLIEASMLRAKGMGYNGVMITCANPLIRDLCKGVFHYAILKEVPIHEFRAKDKAKPFRFANNHHKLQVFHHSFQ